MPVRITMYKCKHCGHRFILECNESFDELEEYLWAHIQMHHETIFDEVQDYETPDMISTAYSFGVYDCTVSSI